MNTNWDLVRQAINTAIDSCEKLERVGYAEHHRGLTVSIGGHDVAVQEFLISAWTLAENARYQVIRERHENGMDLAYVPESARILTAVASACAELIGAGEQPPGGNALLGVVRWLKDHFDPHVEQAITRSASPDSSASPA